MKNLHQIVPATIVLTSALVLSGCNDSSPSAETNVKTASQQSNTAAPAAVPAPGARAEAPKTDEPTKAAPATVKPTAPTDAGLSLSDTAPTANPHDHSHPHAPTAPVADPAAFVVKPDPAVLDFGDIATNDSKVAKLKLVNTSDTPRTLLSARPTCGCTALKVVPNTVIEPGQELELDVQLSGGAAPGPLHGKRITFVIQDHPDLVVDLKANAVSYVVMEPMTLDPETLPDGKFKLRSIDGTAFIVKSMLPSVITEFGTEPKTEHELELPWDRFREVGGSRKLVFYLDHPKCGQVQGTVAMKPTNTVNAEPGLRNPPAPPVLDDAALLANFIKEGRAADIQAKLEGGIDINLRSADGRTLLAQAAHVGQTDIVKMLIDKGADIEAVDKNGRTPMMWAAQSKKVETVQMMLDAGASVTTRDNLNLSALSWAAWTGDGASVVELIDAGSDVHVVGSFTGWTPLILASAFGDPAAIEPLIKAGADLEVADLLQGATALHNAIRTGKVEAVATLIKNGAKIEATDRNGNTALLTAATAPGADAAKVKLLLESGANVNAVDNRKINALELARKRTDSRAAEVIAVLEPVLGQATPQQPAAGQ